MQELSNSSKQIQEALDAMQKQMEEMQKLQSTLAERMDAGEAVEDDFKQAVDAQVRTHGLAPCLLGPHWLERMWA